MRSKRFAIATWDLDGTDVRLKYGDLIVVQHEGATGLDWELVVMPFDPTPLEQGAYRIDVVTIEGRAVAWTSRAVQVEWENSQGQVQRAWVWASAVDRL